jgi:hypothetical protein
MIEEFHDKINGDDHENFQRWRRTNETGFFINIKSSNDVMLHRVICRHPRSTDWEKGEWGTLTKNRKVCSTDKNTLLNWVKKYCSASLKLCRDCKP